MIAANQINIFDRKLVQWHLKRAAKFAGYNALFGEMVGQLIERLGDVKREFPAVLCLGPRDAVFAEHFAAKRGVVMIAGDFSDDEILPFGQDTFDLVISNLNLHWMNDLPGALIQIRNVMKPDGLFLAALPGGQTLIELRTCLMEAELAVTGGVSPRLSPVVDLPTASMLMQRAGFALPVADHETVAITYPNAFDLMHDLRGMGQTNAHRERLRRFTRRAVFFEAERLYQERYAGPTGSSILATYEIIFLHGWKPA